MHTRNKLLIAAAAAALVGSGPASAATLGVDFSDSLADNEPGFEFYDGTGNATSSYTSALGSDGSVEVTAAGQQFRDRTGTPPALQPLLARDFLFDNGVYTVTIEDLNPGVYELATFHHDIDDSVDDGSRFDVASGAATFKHAVETPTTDATSPIRSVTNLLAVDASGTAVLTATKLTGSNGAPLNGFTLSDAAAPSAVGVDFGETLGNESPAGFTPYAGDVNGSQSFVYSDAQGSTVGLSVNMNGSDNRVQDRGGSDPLFTDVLMTNGTTIGLELTGLLEGTYDLRLFHGTDGSQFSGDVDLFVDSVLAGSFAQEPEGSQLFTISSDGVNPILLEYSKATSGAPSWLHVAGLQLDNFVAAEPPPAPEQAPAVPEPATMGLALLGLAGLVRRRR